MVLQWNRSVKVEIKAVMYKKCFQLLLFYAKGLRYRILW